MVLRSICVLFVLAASTVQGTVITGADLLALEGSGVSFPSVRPKSDGTSLVFEGADSLQTLLDYELPGALEISLSVNLTRLECVGSCVNGAADSDPHLLIGDDTWMFGIVFADNLGGQLLAADLFRSTGTRTLTPLVAGVGYPDIDASAKVDLRFLLSSTSTTVEASVLGTTTQFFWLHALSLDNLSFFLLQDNDRGERYQVNSITVPTPVPEPGTLALFAIGFAGMGLARRRKRTLDPRFFPSAERV